MQNQEIEIRTIKPKEIRLESIDGKPTLVGYAIVWNALSSDEGVGFVERFVPGAFDDHLATDPDVYAIAQHDEKQPLGRTSKQTLELRSDEIGIGFNCSLPNTSFANDLIASIEHSDIDGMSFGFIPVEQRWKKEGEIRIREIVKAKLDHISPVTFPAYPQGFVSVRAKEAFDKFVEEEKEKEQQEEEKELTPLLNMATMIHKQKQAEQLEM